MYNILKKTKIQQEKIDNNLKKRGSLWPKFNILYQFSWTLKELNNLKRAKKVIKENKEKIKLIIQSKKELNSINVW